MDNNINSVNKHKNIEIKWHPILVKSEFSLNTHCMIQLSWYRYKRMQSSDAKLFRH
ncbi:hypothetical protein PCIT_a3877 [Pseudoalteromonas citrea]|uniref:Uncharacterized protein n=1 Tax=Pseudoalteromonas citrea TaxID=43655 RepID=A0AAD4AGE5_9GAMM|nr:hypothetical protein PCIT_a3877 [Pseudoalteromonas citrea]